MESPKQAGSAPIGVEVEAGKKYYWCSCGLSEKQPFCDGSHKGSEFSPKEFEAVESKTVWFCTCKASKNPITCDGAHKSLHD